MNFREDGEGSNPNLIKLKDGGHIYGVLRGEVYEFRQHWGDKRSTICPGDGCPLCAKGTKSSFRFRVNCVINEEGKWAPKILEQGWKVYEQLRNINKECVLEQVLLKFSRTGAGQNDTQYFVMPLKPLTGDVAKAIDAVKLLDLHDSLAGQSAGDGDKESAAAGDGLPF